MSEKEQKQWYVIRAIGGKEKKVKEYIETEVHNNHLEDFISQVLIPTEKVYQIKNGKKISREKVSYPGYVLVEAALVGEIPFMLRNTPNVLGFLGDTKASTMEATPLRPQEVYLRPCRRTERRGGGKRGSFLRRRNRQGNRWPVLELFGYDRGGGQRPEETDGFREDIRTQDSYGVEFYAS